MSLARSIRPVLASMAVTVSALAAAISIAPSAHGITHGITLGLTHGLAHGLAHGLPHGLPQGSTRVGSLELSPSELRLYKDEESGKHYWYFTYDVVNASSKEVRFAPRIDLVVDDGRILAQGEGVPSGVVRQLKKFLGNELLEDQFEILGEVLPGKEHAKSGLVVFRAEDLEPTELSVMVQGLSRDTERKPNPKTGDMVTLRKTARIDYLVPGNPKPRGNQTYPIVGREWIFR